MNSFVNYILKKQKGSQVIWWGHVKIVLSLSLSIYIYIYIYAHEWSPVFFFFFLGFWLVIHFRPEPFFFYFILSCYDHLI